MTRKFIFCYDLTQQGICFDDWISFPIPNILKLDKLLSIIESNASKTVTLKNVPANNCSGYDVHAVCESEEDAMIIKLLIG